MEANKLAIYSDCEVCKKIASNLDLPMVSSIHDIISKERQRLYYKRIEIEVDAVMCPDLVEASVERYKKRYDYLGALEAGLRIYSRILEEGK